jgi:hypothetical protein
VSAARVTEWLREDLCEQQALDRAQSSVQLRRHKRQMRTAASPRSAGGMRAHSVQCSICLVASPASMPCKPIALITRTGRCLRSEKALLRLDMHWCWWREYIFYAHDRQVLGGLCFRVHHNFTTARLL